MRLSTSCSQKRLSRALTFIAGPLFILLLTAVLWEIQRREHFFIPNLAVLFLVVLVAACMRGGLIATIINILLALGATFLLYAQVGQLIAEGEWFIRALLPLVAFPAAGTVVYLMRCRIAEATAAPIIAERLLFQAIMSSMHDAIVETDWKGIRDVNASFCKMTGFTREELIGAKAPFPFWPIEQYAAIASALETSMRGAALDFELVLTRKNGERFPVLLSVSRILESAGAANRVLYSFRDITELKRTQERLEESERTLAHAIDAARMGTWVWNINPRRGSWGGHCEALWGLKPGEFDGKFETLLTRIDPRDLPAFNASRDESRRTRSPIKIECRVRWPDGSIHWMQLLGAYIFNEKGEAIRSSGVVQEITERRTAELRLAAESQILEKIARRTALQPTLVALVQMIESILDGSLCSILTLNSDGKTLHIAAAPNLSPDYLKLLEGFEIGPGCGTCGTAVFTGQRTVAKDIQNDPNWAPWKDLATPFNLGSCTSEPIRAKDGRVLGTYGVYFREPREMSKDQLQILEMAAQLAAIAIERDREERELRDAKEVAEIANRTKDRFLNLLSHELRAPLTPILTLARILEGDPRLPAELREDIEMIRRNAEVEARLVDELLDLVRPSNGPLSLRVDTSARALHDMLRPEAPFPPADTASSAKAPCKPLKILLVEDHPDTSSIISRMLSRCGHSVIVANSISAALEMGAAHDFDLLLSDIGLPDGTGHDLIQKLGATRTLPAIALSGFGSNEDIQRSLSAGFLLHLTKPIDFQALHDAIERFTAQ
ncbi:MAG TPA: PAS domain S-box protein [Phycisphaerae bacterium]|nr:PAS domain S-box protein [Phycisphaerae bacterium]